MKKPSAEKNVTFIIFFEFQNNSRRYHISNYTIEIYPSANCSVYNQTYQCHGLQNEVKYKVTIKTFNYSINRIIKDVFYIHPQGTAENN